MPDIRNQLTRVREAANDIAVTATDKIKDGTDKARESAGDIIQTGRDKASDAYSDARDRTQRVAARANEIVQEHPIVAVAGAVAAGAVIAWMFPKSRAAIKALPGLATTAGARVLEAALAARAAAADSADTLKHSAADALLTAKESASDALHAARESAGEAAASARDAAASADLGGKASRLADDVIALVANKVDAVSVALKARLPKN